MSAKASTASKARIAVVVALAVIASFGVALEATNDGDQEAPTHVSILSVALDCQPLDGKKVSIIGAASLGFEDHTICATPEFLRGDPINCLWLSVDQKWGPEDFEKVRKQITSGTFLLIDGIVSCANRGFGGLYGATVEDITLVLEHETGKVLWASDSTIASSQDNH